MIFDREPTDWKELQAMVAQAFIEMGFDAKVSVKVQLVRGKKEMQSLTVLNDKASRTSCAGDEEPD
jgi:hypothetical protein